MWGPGTPPRLLLQTEGQEAWGTGTWEDQFPFHSLSHSQPPAPSGPCFSPAQERTMAAHCLPTTVQLFMLTFEALPRGLPFAFPPHSLKPPPSHHPKSPTLATADSPVFPKCLPVSTPSGHLHGLFPLPRIPFFPLPSGELLPVLQDPLQMVPSQ